MGRIRSKSWRSKKSEGREATGSAEASRGEREGQTYHELDDVEGRAASVEGGDAEVEAVAEAGLPRLPPIRRQRQRDVSGASVESYRPSHLAGAISSWAEDLCCSTGVAAAAGCPPPIPGAGAYSPR